MGRFQAGSKAGVIARSFRGANDCSNSRMQRFGAQFKLLAERVGVSTNLLELPGRIGQNENRSFGPCCLPR